MSDAPTAADWAVALGLRSLIFHVAKRQKRIHSKRSAVVGVADLVSVGLIAAALAVRDYRPEAGRMSTFLSNRAEQHMRHHIRRHGGPVVMPWGAAPMLRQSVLSDSERDDLNKSPRFDPWPAVERRDALRAVLRPGNVDDELLLGWACGWQDAEQGARHGVSGERVRQRRARALDRLKRRMGSSDGVR